MLIKQVAQINGSVAISESYEIVVGASKATGRDRGIGFRSGAAYVFYLTLDRKWVFRQTLVPSGLI